MKLFLFTPPCAVEIVIQNREDEYYFVRWGMREMRELLMKKSNKTFSREKKKKNLFTYSSCST